MDVKEANEPDEILWESLKRKNHKNGGKIALIYLIAFFFIIGSSAIQVIVEGLHFEVKARNTPTNCPSNTE